MRSANTSSILIFRGIAKLPWLQHKMRNHNALGQSDLLVKRGIFNRRKELSNTTRKRTRKNKKNKNKQALYFVVLIFIVKETDRHAQLTNVIFEAERFHVTHTINIL